MRVLVAGAGYVGAALATELSREGHEVLAVRRSDATLAGIRTFSLDLADADAVSKLPSEIDQIVYTVAADGRTDEAYERAYVRGFRNVLDRVAASRVIFVSSTAVYAQDDGGVVDELSEVSGAGTARWLLEGERLAAALGERGVVLRLAGIYGPERDRVVRMVEGGTARLGSGVYGNRIHRDDAVGALAHLLRLSRPAAVYVGVDRAPDLLDDVYLWVAAELGLPPPPAGELDARAADSATHPRGGKRCSSALLVKSGLTFRFPSFREGYREAIDRVLAERAAGR
jgi:nucleoside-diphosphate-sugar epimerase